MKPATAMRMVLILEWLHAPRWHRYSNSVMIFGYNTNGFAHHRFEDALSILAEIGYQSVAITLDHNVLNPYDIDLPAQLERARGLLEKLGLHCVIETGARFLLDPRRKHRPTLTSSRPEERARRLDFLCRAVDIAGALAADAVSLWSGTAEDHAPFPAHLDRLIEGCSRLCEYAAKRQIRLAFEPEPGMLIDTMARYEELFRRVDNPWFGLTIDIGHLHCQGEEPIAEHLRRWHERLWNVHIEDMRRGVHEHLMFGEGEIDVVPVLAALKEIGFRGGIHVELSRHSHDAVNTARRALAFLQTGFIV
jgi:sugar phosphate isomerase/epimerase